MEVLSNLIDINVIILSAPVFEKISTDPFT